tara:strand:- start:300 stop:542 length:243 start_codon:yes stop_codon:yes gene_type:complete
MKQDDIIQTLREVIEEAEHFTTWTVSTPHIVGLVSRAVEAERERITKLLYQMHERASGYHTYYKHAAIEINRDPEEESSV